MQKAIKHTLLGLLSIAISHGIFAQELDPNYRAVLKGRPLFKPVLAPDGNYLVGGSIDFFGEELSGSIIKITPTGEWVSGFNRIVTDGDINHILPLDDGKFLASGKFTKVNGEPVGNLVRFNEDGTVDKSFNTNSSEEIRSFDVQSTGKIIIIGRFENYLGKGYRYLARLNADGSLDESFNNSNSAYINALCINEQDEILISPGYSPVKLTSDGAIDATFSAEIEATVSISHVDFLPDGKLIVAGRDYVTGSNTLRRLNQNGSADSTFTTIEMSHQILTFAILSDGSLAVAGAFSEYNGEPASIVLFNSDGTFDRILAVCDVNSTHTLFEDQSNGIILAGEFHRVNNLQNYYIARLRADYSVDTGFAPEITRSYSPPNFGVQSDGKLIVAGTYDLVGSGNVRSRILRLHQNGAVDASFTPQINSAAVLTCLEVQPDDRILFGGLFLMEGQQNGFFRLLPDGQLDGSFNIGTGPQINSTPTRADVIRYRKSKIYVAGSFTHFNDQSFPYFVILDEDGNIIGPENKSLPSNSIIVDIEVQTDGKIVLMGSFPFPGESAARLIRLLPDGSLDPSFPRISLTNGLLKDVAIDSHNRIIVIGVFPEFNGVPAKDVVRLNDDGTIDPTLSTGGGIPQDLENSMSSVLVLPTDIIAISGSFATYNNQDSPGIVFLKPDGERIPFSADINPISSISDVAFRNNMLYCLGRIIFGDGEDVTSAIRIQFDLPVSVGPFAQMESTNAIPVYPNPFSDRIYIDLPHHSSKTTVKIYSQDGALLLDHQASFADRMVLDVDGLQQGLFFVQVRSANGVIRNVKLVKR